MEWTLKGPKVDVVSVSMLPKKKKPVSGVLDAPRVKELKDAFAKRAAFDGADDGAASDGAAAEPAADGAAAEPAADPDIDAAADAAQVAVAVAASLEQQSADAEQQSADAEGLLDGLLALQAQQRALADSLVEPWLAAQTAVRTAVERCAAALEKLQIANKNADQCDCFVEEQRAKEAGPVPGLEELKEPKGTTGFPWGS